MKAALGEEEKGMKTKPVYFDGSKLDLSWNKSGTARKETFRVTDEMRKKISGNPYRSNNIIIT